MAAPRHSLDVLHLTLRNEAVHARIYYKEAVSQAKEGQSIGVVGLMKERKVPFKSGENILVIPTSYSSSMLGRIARICAVVWRLHPRILHIHTPELLLLALALRMFLGVKLVYDMHEDYLANRLYGQEYERRWWWNAALGYLLRGIERASKPFLTHVFYAEQCYGNLLNMPPGKHSTLENKAFSFEKDEIGVVETPKRFEGMPRLLVTGTIARTWGVFEAIKIWAAVNKHIPVGLVVIGYAPNPKLLAELQAAVAASGLEDRFDLVGGMHFLNPHQIWLMQQHCELGLACYHAAKHIQERIPTKFYEYLAAGKPLFYNNQSKVWDDFLKPWYPGLGFNPHMTEEAAAIILQYLAERPTLAQVPESLYSWEASEAPKLVDVYARLLGTSAKPLTDSIHKAGQTGQPAR